MTDTKPFNHGEEGTHNVCNKHNIGGKSVCCKCSGKVGCGDEPMIHTDKILESSRMFGKNTHHGMLLLEHIYKGEKYIVHKTEKNTVHIIPNKKFEEILQQAVAEGARELIVKLQMIRFGIQVFNKSEQERDQEEKRGLVRRDGGRTMSAFSFIKQIDTEIEKLTKKD